MDIEESQNVSQLLDKESTEAEQKAALRRLGELLEETYILNLPPSKKILKALRTFSKQSQAPVALAKRAAKLDKQYSI